MRSASPALINFLSTATAMVCPDLYTITLSSGTVLRWTSADVDVSLNGQVFSPVAGVTDSGVRSRRGVQTDDFSVTLMADERHAVGGVPLIEFVRRGGLNGANIVVQRAYAHTWEALAAGGPVGAITRFSGRVGEVEDGGSSQATVRCLSWLELLNVQVPTDVYQASCLNSLFDQRCGVQRSSYEFTAQVTGNDGVLTLETTASQPAGFFSGGAILVAGLRRTIRTHEAGGRVVLVSPLPGSPPVGTPVTLWPGCGLTLSDCTTKFNNRLRFRGQPFIPDPETAV